MTNRAKKTMSNIDEILDIPVDVSHREDLSVYNFDVQTYRDGSYKLIAAAATGLIHYTGRFLHHGAQAKRITKRNTVQFDWSGVSFSIRVKKTKSIVIRLKGDGTALMSISLISIVSYFYSPLGNYFNVHFNGEFKCVFKASINATCCEGKVPDKVSFFFFSDVQTTHWNLYIHP
jgi:hypothetical protein